MNELQIITGGAGDDDIKVYSSRADSRPRSGGELPSGDPDFQRRNAGHGTHGKHVDNGNRKDIRGKNAGVSIRRKVADALKISDAAAAAIILIGKYVLLFAVYTIIVCSLSARSARIKATSETAQQYETRIAAYLAEQEEREAAERAAAEEAQRAAVAQIDQERVEAEMLARLLYGVKNNSTDDLYTMAWCVINRVDNPQFPSTVEAVINQPLQWMGYSADNPVLENLYRIADDVLTVWRSGGHRPVSDEYVYMSWSEYDIVLRDNFTEKGSTHYWRYK